MLDSSIVMLYAVPVPVLLTVMIKLTVSPTAMLTTFVGVFVTIRFGSFFTIDNVLIAIGNLTTSPFAFSACAILVTLFVTFPSVI